LRDSWHEPIELSDKLSGEIEVGVIKKIADLYRSLPTLAQEAARLRKRRYAWVGCIVRDPSGNAVASVQRTVEGDGQLCVARQSDESPTHTDIVVVGRLAAGQPTLNGNVSDQIAGRPLFHVAD